MNFPILSYPRVTIHPKLQCSLILSTVFLHAEYQECPSSDGPPTRQWVVTDKAEGSQLGNEQRVKEKETMLGLTLYLVLRTVNVALYHYFIREMGQAYLYALIFVCINMYVACIMFEDNTSR